MPEENYYGIMGKNSRLFSVLFFVIGLIGAIGLRIVLIINRFSYLFASLVWYLAIISYILFYFYRYHIEQERRGLLISGRLKHKLSHNLELDETDKKNLRKVVDSLLVSKQNLNLVILIIVSIISLIIQITLDFVIK